MDLLFLNKILPAEMFAEIHQTISKYRIVPEELRIRVGQAPVLRCSFEEYTCQKPVSPKDISYIMMNATNGAWHTSLRAIQNGYLNLPHGCRLGICGEGTSIDHQLYNFRYISSLCFRFAKECFGCANSVFQTYREYGFQNSIIIAPPGIGKTTFLRDCIRLLSNEGNYIGVADERGEISGMSQGISYFDLGSRTDIIYGIKKQQAVSLLLRTMSPDIIAMDEITSYHDLPAVKEVIGCGVSLLTTIHGTDLEDLKKPSFREIFDLKVFRYAILISIINKERIYRMEKLYG